MSASPEDAAVELMRARLRDAEVVLGMVLAGSVRAARMLTTRYANRYPTPLASVADIDAAMEPPHCKTCTCKP